MMTIIVYPREYCMPGTRTVRWWESARQEGEAMTDPSEYCMPGTRTVRWWESAPGRTSTSSVRREKQPWRVLTLFSFSCL